MYHIFFIHSSVDGNLGCCHVLASVNNPAMNIGVHAFLLSFPASRNHLCLLLADDPFLASFPSPMPFVTSTRIPSYFPLLRTLVTGDVRLTQIIQGSLPIFGTISLSSDPYLNHNCKFLFTLCGNVVTVFKDSNVETL